MYRRGLANLHSLGGATKRRKRLASVVVLCRDEERFIGSCLESVLDWQIEDWLEIEILVVEGASKDNTRGIIQQFADANPTIRLIDNPTGTKPAGMNLGIAAAGGEFIVRLDAHSEYPPDYLTECINTVLRTGAQNVGGVVIPRLRNSSASAVIVQAITTSPFGVGGSSFRLTPEDGPVDTVPYGCFPRATFDEYGVFDERLLHSQDYEFNRRVAHRGGVVWINPKIVVHYYNQSSLRAFLEKTLHRDGPWNAYMWRLAPYTFKARHAVPLAAVMTGMLLVGASLFWPGARATLGILVAAYASVALWSSWIQAHRLGRPMLLVALPLGFLAYHGCNGIGTLVGALRLATGTAPVPRYDK